MIPELRAWLSTLLDAVENTDDPAYVVTLVSHLRGELYRLPLTEPTELEADEDRP